MAYVLPQRSRPGFCGLLREKTRAHHAGAHMPAPSPAGQQPARSTAPEVRTWGAVNSRAGVVSRVPPLLPPLPRPVPCCCRHRSCRMPSTVATQSVSGSMLNHRKANEMSMVSAQGPHQNRNEDGSGRQPRQLATAGRPAGQTQQLQQQLLHSSSNRCCSPAGTSGRHGSRTMQADRA